MGRKTSPGLYQRDGIWHIDKRIKGYGRLCESTGTVEQEEAERYLRLRLTEIREATVYGVRPRHLFREAATKYLLDNQHMPSIGDTAMHLRQLDPFIGDLPLGRVHDATLKPFVNARQRQGVSNRTINIALQRVVRILRLAASVWRDEHEMTWLDRAPHVTVLPETNRRPAYPLSWEEQEYLLKSLPAHLARMALYKMNSGCREQEVCRLQWDWEVKVPELSTSVFLIPLDFGGRRPNSGVKNREDRLVVLNDVAKSVIEAQRGLHPVWVFLYRGRPLAKMNDSAWKRGRAQAAQQWRQDTGEPAHPGFAHLRVHDLKHTFGRRLRVAGVSFEDRQALLGHKSESVTTDYSAAEIAHLIAQANKVMLGNPRSSPTLTVLRRKSA
jgi:integrase